MSDAPDGTWIMEKRRYWNPYPIIIWEVIWKWVKVNQLTPPPPAATPSGDDPTGEPSAGSAISG